MSLRNFMLVTITICCLKLGSASDVYLTVSTGQAFVDALRQQTAQGDDLTIIVNSSSITTANVTLPPLRETAISSGQLSLVGLKPERTLIDLSWRRAVTVSGLEASG